MKIKLALALAVAIPFCSLAAEVPTNVKFAPPPKKIERDVMTAFANRKSAESFSLKPISQEQLGNLLWAANGVNRPESGKRTAPSALNKQDVILYVFDQWNVYLYDAASHSMSLVVKGDHRSLFTERLKAPTIVLLVSDISKFDSVPGSAEDHKITGALDAGIVSQNIGIYCASVGIAARVRVSMDKQGIAKLLKLPDSQIPFLNYALGYEK